MISERSAGVIDAKIQLCHHKTIKNCYLNHYNISQYYRFYCIFDQINAAVVSMRHLSKTLKIIIIIIIIIKKKNIYIYIYVYISAVKRLITINHIQKKSFCLHNIYVCIVYIYFVYINTHTWIYLRKLCFVYILNIFMYNINYMNKNICNVNIF